MTAARQVCNNICDGIESVPYHKVFSFGGKKGMMQYMNEVEVMDAGTQVRLPHSHDLDSCHECCAFFVVNAALPVAHA